MQVSENDMNERKWVRPAIDAFARITETCISPYLSEIGFEPHHVIDGGNYYAYVFARNGWGLMVYFEWREDYLDIRVASDIEFVAFGMNLLTAARRIGIKVVGIESASLLPFDDRLEWWSNKILQPILPYLSDRTKEAPPIWPVRSH